MSIPKEKKDKLYKGLFWVKDVKNIVKDSVCFLVPYDKEGNGDVSGYDSSVVSKSGDSLNHKRLWETLSSNITYNKPFDYYPRGRVEIKNRKAKVFVPPDLVEFKEAIIKFCKDKFNLSFENGIKNIEMYIDGSEHYKPKMYDL